MGQTVSLPRISDLFIRFSSRSFHPYANPEVLSFAVQDGSLSYMRWMDEAVPDD